MAAGNRSIRRGIALALMLGVAACSSQNAAPGEPGSVVVHMGGSVTSFGAVTSSSH